MGSTHFRYLIFCNLCMDHKIGFFFSEFFFQLRINLSAKKSKSVTGGAVSKSGRGGARVAALRSIGRKHASNQTKGAETGGFGIARNCCAFGLELANRDDVEVDRGVIRVVSAPARILFL